ncbi:MAG: sporulation protein YunB [Christensenellales bacterium]
MYVQYIKPQKRKKRLTTKKKYMLAAICFVLVIIGVLLYFNFIINPVILSMSEIKVKSLTQRAVNQAVYEVANAGPVYDDMIKISRNESGMVTLISADAIEINRLARDLVKLSEIKLGEIAERGISIPIGTFSGMPIFVGRGPEVRIRLIPIGVISCNFRSEFREAGINQTNHRIYVNINSNVSVVMPTQNQSIATTTELLLAESIIIGSIPNTYLYSESLDEMLNLIPN